VTRKKTKIKVNATGPEQTAAGAAGPENTPVEGAAEALEAVSETTGESEVSALQLELEQAQTRAAEYLDGLQRERAEFQNFKKRIERERGEQQQAILGQVLLKLLPVVDDFDRAMEMVPADQRNEWFSGVALIQRKLEGLLKEYGVTEIEAQGRPFDPMVHEAIGMDDVPDVASGTVTQVVQRGYKLNDRVLRAARVRVAN